MTENTERPVFIVSSPRSGSTLLRLILDAHPRLAVPPPAWLTHFIYPYLYSYGDLSERGQSRRNDRGLPRHADDPRLAHLAERS